MCNNSSGYFLSAFSDIINDFKPDIIHIWGSEAPFGLIYSCTTIPIVLHIQGIIIPCNNAYLPPFVSYRSYLNSSLSLKYRLDKYLEKIRWKSLAYREKLIFWGIKNYMGRTDWDCRVTHILNPNSNYYHVDEILRDIFYLPANRIIPQKLTIITTISQPLYKGFDLVLKTANLLKNQLGLDFEWICYGNINPSFIEKVVGITHEQVNIMLKGVASAEQLRDAEICATLYFHSSYIDNSPNSICEAQMLGLPIVSTNVGGIPSLVDHGVDGFLFPSNDPYQAAYFIEKLFLNPDLNNQMGEKGKQKAVCRHDRNRVREQILNVYKSVTK
jgi:glycosyltransferase involved in cell wall biosynthesis